MKELAQESHVGNERDRRYPHVRRVEEGRKREKKSRQDGRNETGDSMVNKKLTREGQGSFK